MQSRIDCAEQKLSEIKQQLKQLQAAREYFNARATVKKGLSFGESTRIAATNSLFSGLVNWVLDRFEVATLFKCKESAAAIAAAQEIMDKQEAAYQIVCKRNCLQYLNETNLDWLETGLTRSKDPYERELARDHNNRLPHHQSRLQLFDQEISNGVTVTTVPNISAQPTPDPQAAVPLPAHNRQ